LILNVATSLLLTATISRKPLLQAVRINSKFPSDEQGFIAFIRINQESPKAGKDSLAFNPSGFVGGALAQSLQLLPAYLWKGQRLPLLVALVFAVGPPLIKAGL